MEKIKKYVEKFFKANSGNTRYQIYSGDVAAAREEMHNDPFGTILTLFNYGYAKGYRAAMAEMKKGGAPV